MESITCFRECRGDLWRRWESRSLPKFHEIIFIWPEILGQCNFFMLRHLRSKLTSLRHLPRGWVAAHWMEHFHCCHYYSHSLHWFELVQRPGSGRENSWNRHRAFSGSIISFSPEMVGLHIWGWTQTRPQLIAFCPENKETLRQSLGFPGLHIYSWMNLKENHLGAEIFKLCYQQLLGC